MSREVIIHIRDDFDGSDADETVAFSYRGETYEIDLSSANVERFDKTMHEFIEAARVVEQQQPKRRVAASGATYAPKPPQKVLEQRRQIRDWARSQGRDLQDRGMIAASIIDEFTAAHPDVVLLPGTAGNYQRSPASSKPALVSVSAQDAQNGLLTLADVAPTSMKSETGVACDPNGKPLTKKQRDVIRAWAEQNGLDQPPKGMLRTEVLTAYFAAKQQKTS